MEFQNETLLEQSELDDELKEDLDEAIAHGILVSNLAFYLSQELGFSQEYCYEMAKAGMLHDIGKLRLGHLLYGRKKGSLKIEEMKYVRMHPELGYESLKEIGGYSTTILRSIYHHHENFDGSGYPDNIKGEKIPYGARILRTCDVFAALVSDRAYRSAFDIDTAIELMIDEVKNFDMEIFLAFMKVVYSDNFTKIRDYIEEINRKYMKQPAV
ncbi:HD-GYP domain-containing protein [Clostridium sp. Marseille-P299]|uniref:HD-GYP domain-containing protein n=1 Tax=Clostridium sp. Marseille-P299 TaxID=1805477 RepID=UPI0009EE4CFE|nr:HD domain-containing phosphohydrolase [Clostridium sp. Marseille-P299]